MIHNVYHSLSSSSATSTATSSTTPTQNSSASLSNPHMFSLNNINKSNSATFNKRDQQPRSKMISKSNNQDRTSFIENHINNNNFNLNEFEEIPLNDHEFIGVLGGDDSLNDVTSLNNQIDEIILVPQSMNENSKMPFNLKSSRIPTPVSAKNNKYLRENSLDLLNVPQPDLIMDEEEKIENPINMSSQGAFKIYNNEINDKKQSPRKPVKKYVNGSTTSVITTKINNKMHMKKNTQSDLLRSSAATTTAYTLDSDESIVVEDLLNDKDKLKEKLKESKLNRDQLIQLQEDYVKLLEQYAEAENFIDTFRLMGQMGLNFSSETPNMKIFQVRKN
jgi:hypothetical protein